MTILLLLLLLLSSAYPYSAFRKVNVGLAQHGAMHHGLLRYIHLWTQKAYEREINTMHMVLYGLWPL